MVSSSGEDEFNSPQSSISTLLAGLLERAFVSGARLSVPLILVAITVFFTYVIGGFVLLSLGYWSPSYPFLSPSQDIYFAWLAFLTGEVVCLGTGSLIGLAFLSDGRGPIHNQVSILASFVGFGFGAGAMQMTYPTILSTIL